MKFFLKLEDHPEPIEIECEMRGSDLVVNGIRHPLDLGKKTVIRTIINNRPVTIRCAIRGQEFFVSCDGQTSRWQFKTEQQLLREQASGSSRESDLSISAKMPGKVVRILVKEGDKLALDQPVLVLEAMKMENEIRSKGELTVEKIHVAVNQNVESGAILVSMKKDP